MASSNGSEGNRCGDSEKIVSPGEQAQHEEEAKEASSDRSSFLEENGLSTKRDRYSQKGNDLGADGRDEASNDSDDEDDNGMEELLLLDDAGQEELDDQEDKKAAEEE